jgi:hypothetical protein
MRIRTHLRAGGIWENHNEALKVRTALKAGIEGAPGPGGIRLGNHNEALQVRTALKAGGRGLNHSETLGRKSDKPAISMRRQIRTTVTKGDRLELLVVRAGLRAGARRIERGLGRR